MLTITEAAEDAVSTLTAEEGQQPGSGLRFAIHTEDESQAQLAISIADSPAQDDHVLNSEKGAQVFLEPQAAQFLDDKVLDVQQDDQGQLNFAVMQQPDS